MTTITARRRIECAVSGGATVLSGLVVVGLVVGLIVWTSHFNAHILDYVATAFFGFIALLFVLAIVAALVAETVRHDVFPGYVLSQQEVATRVKSLSTKVALWWFEGSFLWLFILYPPEHLRPVIKGAAPALVVILLTQVVFTALGSLVWIGLSRRLTLGRIGSLFVLTQISFWALYEQPHVVRFVADPSVANLICFIGAVPIIAIILGAAYSCDRNIFDMVRK